MMRALSLITLAAALVVFSDGASAADGDKPEKGKGKGLFQDPEALFKKLDADGNGKISKDEFKKLADLLPEAAKEKAGAFLEKRGDQMFQRLDANGDGELTLEEFKK